LRDTTWETRVYAHVRANRFLQLLAAHLAGLFAAAFVDHGSRLEQDLFAMGLASAEVSSALKANNQ
jgi:hypothetical protein